MQNLLNFLKTKWLHKDEVSRYFNNEKNFVEGDFSLELFESIFGEYLEQISEQDSYRRSKITDCYGNNLVALVEENQGCWTLATNENLSKMYCNAWNLIGNRAMNEFQEMNFGIQESLISFVYQEVFCNAPFEISVKTPILQKLKETAIPLWVDKRYVWNEPTHSFYYHEAQSILIFDMFSEGLGGYVVSNKKSK